MKQQSNAILDAGGALIGYFCADCAPEVEIAEDLELAIVEPDADDICFRCGEIMIAGA